MRKLFLLEKPLLWDDPVPLENQEEWVNLMKETLLSGDLLFPRCVRPDNAIEGLGPELVGCSDYGQGGYDARIYIRWKLTDDADSSYASRLGICKSRVPPLSGLTVPCGELTGLLLQSRLLMTVVQALQKLDYPPVAAFMLVYSKCCLLYTSPSPRDS